MFTDVYGIKRNIHRQVRKEIVAILAYKNYLRVLKLNVLYFGNF